MPRALAAARSVDEVKDIRNKAIAIQAYAKQVNNKDLEADAFEIRKRAEDKLGEKMKEEPKAPAGRPGKNRVFQKPDLPKSYREIGIDKNLADHARKTHAMPRNEFEKMIREGRGKIYRRAERAAVSKSARKEKHKAIAALAKANVKAGVIGSFSLIYADPPWKWGHFAIIGLGRIEMRISQLKLKDTLLPSRRCDSLAALRRGAKATARLSGWVSRLPWLAPCTTGR